MASEGFGDRASWRSKLFSRLGLAAGLLLGCAVGDDPPASFGAPGYTTADRPNPTVEPLTAGDEPDDDARSGSPGSCCEVTNASGCLDAVVEDCVCQLDRDCCSVGWDATCIVTAQSACGACGGTPPGPSDDDHGDDDDEGGSTGGDDGEPPPADCCQPTAATGCGEPALEQCVCAIDPFCCQQEWDDVCVQVAENECGACGGGGGGNPVPPVPPCCEPQAGPGCTQPLLEVCVCAFDPFCCQQEWDAQCVDVASLLCGACG